MKYNNKRFAIILVGVFVLVFAMQFVTAQGSSPDFVGDVRELLEKWGILPTDVVGNDVLWIFVGIFGSLVLVLIMADLLMAISPWSDYINWVLAVGVFIVLALVGAIRGAVAGVFSFAGVLFGAGSALALIMTAVVFFAAVIFVFVGGSKIQGWIANVKNRKQILRAQKKGVKSAESTVKGKTVLDAVGSTDVGV